MAFFIKIDKIEENARLAVYAFCTDLENKGKVSIDKKTGECFIVEESDNDRESKLAIRVMRVLIQHRKKGELPEKTCWAS